MSSRFSVEALARLIEDDLKGMWLAEGDLSECLEAHAYPTVAGGKRIRPLLVLLAAAAFGGEEALRRARPTACALECVHTYSLVHDDLPCMDNDALRRGRPTTHIIYGEAKALLVGDGLLTHAFTLVSSRGRSAPWLETLSSREEACDVAETLAAAAGPYGMVGGQWLDIAATGHANKDQRRGTLTPKDFRTVENIHRLKTGRLLGAALECGVVHGIAHLRASLEPETFEHLLSSAREKARLAGELTGVAFQIVDDILDVTHTSDALGKTAGKDLETGKLTSVSTLGLEGARAQAVAFTAQAQKALSELLALAPASRKTPHGAERISPQGTTSGVAPHCANLLKQTLETMLQRET